MKWLMMIVAWMCLTSGVWADEFDPPAVAGKFSGMVTGKVNWRHNSNTWFMFWVEKMEPDASGGDARQYAPLLKLPQGLKVGIEWTPSANPEHEAFVKSLKPGDRFKLKLTPNWEKTGVRLAEVPGKGAAAGGGTAGVTLAEGEILDAKGFVVPVQPKLQEPLKSVEPSRVHGAVIDESKVGVVLLVNPASPAANDANDGSTDKPMKSFGAALKKALAAMAKGKGVKIRLAAGEYREGEFEVNGKVTPGIADAVLIIEGEAPGKVAFKGSDLAKNWSAVKDGVYATAWPHKLGFWPGLMGQYNIKELLGQRREMVFVDGKFQIPTILERHRYEQRKVTGGEGKAAAGQHGGDMEYEQVGRWEYLSFNDPVTALKPGTFGVAERPENGEKLFVRLADGSDPAAHTVEVAVRKWFMRVTHKDNVVVRNVSIEHYATSYHAEDLWRRFGALQFGIGGEGELQLHNVLVENVSAMWNSGGAISFGYTQGLTVRNVVSNYNGCGGLSHGGTVDMLWENVTTNFNNWRGVLGNCYSWSMAGTKFHTFRDAIIRNHVAIGNQTGGLWYDVDARNVLMDRPVSIGNTFGVFLEICKGPLEVRDGLFADNSGSGIQILCAEHVTLKNNLVWNGPASAGSAAAVAKYNADIGKNWSVIRTGISFMHYPRSSMTNEANWDVLGQAMNGGPKRHIAHWLPGPVLAEGNAVLEESANREVMVYSPWLPWELRSDEMWKRSWSGKDNFYFALNPHPLIYNNYDKPEGSLDRTERMDVAAWSKRFGGETGSRFGQPKLIDPAHGDFTPAADSPLIGKAGSPAYRKIDPAVYREWEHFNALVKKLEAARDAIREAKQPS